MQEGSELESSHLETGSVRWLLDCLWISNKDLGLHQNLYKPTSTSAQDTIPETNLEVEKKFAHPSDIIHMKKKNQAPSRAFPVIRTSLPY